MSKASPFSVFRGLQKPISLHPAIRVGALVKIMCFAEAVFPIKGIDAGLWLLDPLAEPEELAWGVFCSPNDKLLGMVVWEGKNKKGNPVWEVLLGDRELVIRLDPETMETYPYETFPGSWQMIPLSCPEDV